MSNACTLLLALSVLGGAGIHVHHAPAYRAPDNVRIEDPYTRDAVRSALDRALEWLSRAKCQRLFLEFRDARDRPLLDRLRELDVDPATYFRAVVLLDGAGSPTCKKDGVLAFTVPATPVIYVCGRDFERAWRRDAREVTAAIVHEWLHVLGLGETLQRPARLRIGFSSSAGKGDLQALTA